MVSHTQTHSDAGPIVVAGASGRTSTAVLAALLASPAAPRVRALVRSPAAAADLGSRFAGLDVRVVGDYADATSAPALDAAFAGARAVWYNAPAFVPGAQTGVEAVVEAAKRAGAAVVFCSIAHPHVTALPNHTDKLEMEEYIIESGVPYTILQPQFFQDNIPLGAVLASGKFPSWVLPTAPVGMVALADVGAAAALIMQDPARHAYATYEVVSENTTFARIAAQLGAASGKHIECAALPRDTAIGMLSAHWESLSAQTRDGVEKMVDYYIDRPEGAPGNANVLRWLLGREPTTWADRIAHELEAGAAKAA